MERKRSGIPGKNEAAGSASSTPYMARTRKALHYAISGNKVESTYVNFPH
jgi:hypothetical protein